MSNFKTNTFKTAAMQAIAIITLISAMSAPIQADAAKLPGTCDLVRNTMCDQPTSLLDQFLAIIKWA